MARLNDPSESEKSDQDPIIKIEDSEETTESILSVDLEKLEELEEFEGEEYYNEDGEDEEFDGESDEESIDDLLNDDLVDYLDEICLEVDNTVLEKILLSNSGYTESQMAVLRYNDDKIYYLADYDGGNTLRTDVGDFQKGDEYDIVSVQVPVATITNKEKNIPDLMPEDVELMHFNMESDFSMEFYETYEDAEALYGDSEDSDEDDLDENDEDLQENLDESESDENESDESESDENESDESESNESESNNKDNINNESKDNNESDESSVDSVDPENVLWEGQLKDILH